MASSAQITQLYRIVVKASPQAVWDALTKPEWSERYGYGGKVHYDLKPGGRFRHEASPEMKSFGMPEDIILGQVVECSAPHKLVQTWHPQFTPAHIAEADTRVTYEIQEHQGGVCTVTLTHDVTDAPMVAAMVPGGGDPAQGTGGWPWVLSDLKSLLETGKRM